jgi:hypothetical protein
VPVVNQPLVPTAAAPAGGGFTLMANGTGFVSGAYVQWYGNPRSTTFVSSKQVTAAIPASDIASASTASVTVVNPPTGGGTSQTVLLPITNPSSSVAFGRTEVATGPVPVVATPVDLNHDGMMDVVVSNAADNNISVFMGGVMNAPSGNIGVLLGNGDGTFQSPLNFAAVTSPGTQSAAADVGDFDGDGRLDLVTTNPSANTISIFLQGSPVALFPASLDFGNQTVGTSSATQTVTLTNLGPGPLTISNIATSNGFGAPLPNTSGLPACPLLIGQPLAANSSFRTLVFFAPTSIGSLAGTLTITDDAPGSPQVVPLAGAGTGTPAISFSPTSVNFPRNPMGVNCPTKGVTIINNGPSALTLSSLSGITAPFTIDASSTTCAVNTPVASGQSCAINFKFSPTGVGTVNQTLTITSNAQGSPHSVAVSGTGTPACQLLAKAHTATVLRGTDAQDFAIEDAKPSCSPVSINLSCSAANPVACALAPAVIAPGAGRARSR